MTSNIKLVVFVPLSHADKVREAVGKAGAGKIGNYDFCSFSSRGVGRFKPNEKANPHIGSANKLEEVEEERIEFVCPREKAKEVISVMKKAHPYEEVAFFIQELVEEGDL